MNLLQKRNVKLRSGGSDFKIECDALSDDDIECAAFLISKMIKFNDVVGVPTGGLRLAEALKKYRTNDFKLTKIICDDVLTTGKSMEELREKEMYPCSGVVIFARGYCPPWIKPLFQLNSGCY